MREFWIQGNVPSSKNSQQIQPLDRENSKTNPRGLPFRLISSSATHKWRRETVNTFLSQRILFRDELKGLSIPYYIEFTFIRKSNQRFDYINAAQAICDAMVKNLWIVDDNSDVIKPYFGDYRVDKVNPGVIIKVLRTKPNHYAIQTHPTTDQ